METKKLTFYLTIMFFISSVQMLHAYTLQGTIVSVEDEAMAGASVVLFAAGNDSVPVSGTSSDEQGVFALKADGGDYRLRTSFMGMKTEWREISLTGDTDMGKIVMRVDTLLADEVTITAQFVKHKPNSITISMQGNPIARGATGYDMLYKIPGMYGMSIYGRPVAKVYVDGMETDMDAVLAMLQSMRAEDIESFELIPIADVSEGATVNGSVLRITLKKNREDGANIYANVEMTYPYEGKTVDSQYGVTARAKVGKVESYTYVGFRNEHTWPTHFYISRVYDDNTSLKIDEDRVAGNRYNQLFAQQTLRYNINKNHMVGGRFHITWHPSTHALSNTAYSGNTTSLLYPEKTRTVYETFYRYMQGYAYYTWLFDERGSGLSVSFQVYRALRGNAQEFVNYYQDETTDTIENAFPSDHMVYYPRVDFAKVFANGMVLRAVARYLHTTGAMPRTETTSYSNVPSVTSFTPFDYKENLYTAFASLQGSLFDRRLTYNVGVNVQHIATRYHMDSDIFYQSTGVFPSLSLQYAVNQDKGSYSSLTYSTYTGYPTGSLLNPVRYRTGSYEYWEGNPNLKAPYNHRLQLRQTINNIFAVSLNGTWVVDPISTKYTVGDDHKTIYRTAENYGSYDTYMLSVMYNSMVTSWLHINVGASGWCNYENSRQYGKHTYWNGRVYGVFTAYLPKSWQILLQGSFRGEERQYNVITYPHLSMHVSVQKSLLNNSLTMSLDVGNMPAMDIVTRTDYGEYYDVSRSNSYRMFATFSLSYTFDIGKKNVKAREVTADGLAIERAN